MKMSCICTLNITRATSHISCWPYEMKQERKWMRKWLFHSGILNFFPWKKKCTKVCIKSLLISITKVTREGKRLWVKQTCMMTASNFQSSICKLRDSSTSLLHRACSGVWMYSVMHPPEALHGHTVERMAAEVMVSSKTCHEASLLSARQRTCVKLWVK